MTVGAATALRAKSSAALFVLTVPAPRVSLRQFCAHAPLADTVMWAPDGDHAYAGAGIAAELSATGPERFAWMERRARELLANASEHAADGVAAPPLRLFGGFSFAPGAAAAEPWHAFGDARFILPTWSYGHTDDGAWLRLISHDRHRAPDAVAAVVDALKTAAPIDETAPPHIPTRVVDEIDPHAWHHMIASIHDAIAAGQSQKIVAAHCKTLDLGRDIDHRRVFSRLDEHYPDCHRFALSFGDAHFVGATPERLIRRAGGNIVTEALAGSIAASDGADALLASDKDRGEQQLVVSSIAAVLEPLCSDITIPDAPHIRQLRHVLHLETPIRGVLRRPAHVVELAGALHPTPAVGGVPTNVAMKWIDEVEHSPRGWYAAPVGWFDAEGDGEFVVAIRSALLRGRRAHVYAGAGIVRDSKADAELIETQIKQKALLGALGVAG